MPGSPLYERTRRDFAKGCAEVLAAQRALAKGLRYKREMAAKTVRKGGGPSQQGGLHMRGDPLGKKRELIVRVHDLTS